MNTAGRPDRAIGNPIRPVRLDFDVTDSALVAVVHANEFSKIDGTTHTWAKVVSVRAAILQAQGRADHPSRLRPGRRRNCTLYRASARGEPDGSTPVAGFLAENPRMDCKVW